MPEETQLDAGQIIGSLQRQLAQSNYRVAVLEAQVAALSTDLVDEEATESPKGEDVDSDEE